MQKNHNFLCRESQLRLSTAQQHGFYETEKSVFFIHFITFSVSIVYNKENRNSVFHFEFNWKENSQATTDIRAFSKFIFLVIMNVKSHLNSQ